MKSWEKRERQVQKPCGWKELFVFMGQGGWFCLPSEDGLPPVLRVSLGHVMGLEFCLFQMEQNRRPRYGGHSSSSCDSETSQGGILVKSCFWRPDIVRLGRLWTDRIWTQSSEHLCTCGGEANRSLQKAVRYKYAWRVDTKSFFFSKLCALCYKVP